VNAPERFAHLLQAFFCDHLVKQRDLSPRTISVYRDTFRLLLNFFHEVHGKARSIDTFDLNATLLLDFLQHLEEKRGNCVRTRNVRLAALRSFIRYAGACEGPDMIAHTQRIMAIPLKRFVRPMLGFLSANEMQAILEAIGNSWTGRRDHLLFFLYNTGARVSEAISAVCKTFRDTITALWSCWAKAESNALFLWKETTHHPRVVEAFRSQTRSAFATQSLWLSTDQNRSSTKTSIIRAGCRR
jgi:site-specific recombinase XerD